MKNYPLKNDFEKKSDDNKKQKKNKKKTVKIDFEKNQMRSKA